MTLTAQTRIEAIWSALQQWCSVETYYSPRDCYWCWRRKEENGDERFVVTIGDRVAVWFRFTEEELEEKPVEVFQADIEIALQPHRVPQERRDNVDA